MIEISHLRFEKTQGSRGKGRQGCGKPHPCLPYNPLKDGLFEPQVRNLLITIDVSVIQPTLSLIR